jgi:hypothetical protein
LFARAQHGKNGAGALSMLLMNDTAQAAFEGRNASDQAAAT